MQQNQVGAKFQKQDVFWGIVGLHLVEQYLTIRWFWGLHTANWIITIKSSWTKLPRLFYQTESIQQRIFLSSSNIFALLTFRQGQIPEFNSLDETRSLFSNLWRCAPKVWVITLFHLAKNTEKLATTSHTVVMCLQPLRAKICIFPQDLQLLFSNEFTLHWWAILHSNLR